MSQPKTYYTPKELCSLPGLPNSVPGIHGKAKRESWSFRQRKGQGGGVEYAFASLPPETCDFLVRQAVVSVPASAPDPAERLLPALAPQKHLPATSELTKKQIAVMDARVWFMKLIEHHEKQRGGVKRALKAILEAIADGEENICRMADIANDRKGKDRTLSERTLKRWRGDWLEAGRSATALAPQDSDRVSREAGLMAWVRDYAPGCRDLVPPGVPAWLPWFLDEYRISTKPDVADAHRKMSKHFPRDLEYPSYDQVKRVCNKIATIYLEKHRMTGAEYKQILGFTRRDSSDYDPFTIGQIDGHSFKAYVAHPTTGAHFHPEVCGIICLTTKVLAGFAAGLAESSRTVADAYRHACTIDEKKPWGGVFAIIEPDRGSGNLAKVNAHEFLGRFARIGTTFLPPERGGNPQGHGAIERSNKSIWIRAAKELPTYTGKDMDRGVRKRVYVRLERDLKAMKKDDQLGLAEKTSKLLLSWREFLEFLEEKALEYNNTPHSALAKITAPPPWNPKGKAIRRHMTPFESLADRIARGWQPMLPPQGEFLPHLFMPHEEVDVKRAEFNLHGNRYHAYELNRYHGQTLVAAYDIHDAKTVWVLDHDERVICKATWNGNKKAAQPESVIEQAIRQRAERQIKLKQQQIDLHEAEKRQAVVIEHSAAVLAKCAPLELELKEEAPPVRVASFTIPASQTGKYRYWKDLDARIAAGGAVADDEKRFWTGFRNSAAWEAEAMFDPEMRQKAAL